jgi:hypothetical protein
VNESPAKVLISGILTCYALELRQHNPTSGLNDELGAETKIEKSNRAERWQEYLWPDNDAFTNLEFPRMDLELPGPSTHIRGQLVTWKRECFFKIDARLLPRGHHLRQVARHEIESYAYTLINVIHWNGKREESKFKEKKTRFIRYKAPGGTRRIDNKILLRKEAPLLDAPLLMFNDVSRHLNGLINSLRDHRTSRPAANDNQLITRREVSKTYMKYHGHQIIAWHFEESIHHCLKNPKTRDPWIKTQESQFELLGTVKRQPPKYPNFSQLFSKVEYVNRRYSNHSGRPTALFPNKDSDPELPLALFQLGSECKSNSEGDGPKNSHVRSPIKQVANIVFPCPRDPTGPAKSQPSAHSNHRCISEAKRRKVMDLFRNSHESVTNYQTWFWKDNDDCLRKSNDGYNSKIPGIPKTSSAQKAVRESPTARSPVDKDHQATRREPENKMPESRQLLSNTSNQIIQRPILATKEPKLKNSIEQSLKDHKSMLQAFKTDWSKQNMSQHMKDLILARLSTNEYLQAFDDGKADKHDDLRVIVDSGASIHIFDTKEAFTELYTVKPRVISVGKNECRFTTTRAGWVHLITYNNHGEPQRFSLWAFYSPEANGNFCSTVQLDDMGYGVHQSKGEIQIYNEYAAHTASAFRKGKSFILDCKLPTWDEDWLAKPPLERSRGKRARIAAFLCQFAVKQPKMSKTSNNHHPTQSRRKSKRFPEILEQKTNKDHNSIYGNTTGITSAMARKINKKNHVKPHQPSSNREPILHTERADFRKAQELVCADAAKQYQIEENKVSSKRLKNGENRTSAKNSTKSINSRKANKPSRGRPVSIAQLHCSLGHVSLKKIRQTIKATTGIKATSIPKTIQCHACHVTKCKKPRKFNRSLHTESKNRVHSDLKTFSSLSMKSYKGFSLYVHEGTRFAVIYLFRYKSETDDFTKLYFAKYKTIFEHKWPTSALEWRTDGGGEFISKRIQDYIRGEGVLWTPSPARTPHLNGISERTIQSIVNMAKAMLAHSGLSKGFWAYACLAATYVYNRTVHSKLKNTTPVEALTGKPPDISELKTFGCMALAHIPKEDRANGLSNNGEIVRFIGYSNRFKTYVTMSHSGKIRRLRIDRFFEDKFIFPTEIDVANTEAFNVQQKHDQSDINTLPKFDFRVLPSNLWSSRAPTPPVDNRPHYSRQSPRQSNRPGRSIRNRVFDNRFGAVLFKMATCNRKPKQQTKPSSQVISGAEYKSVFEIDQVPTSYKEAVTGPERRYWIPAIEEEFKNMKHNKVFTEVLVKQQTPLVSTRFVFKKKPLSENRCRFKARLVARGFSQVKGVNVFETYASTLSLSSLRLMISIAGHLNFKINSVDVESAFLEAKLDELVYLSIPDGYNATLKTTDSHIVALKCNKAIYGLSQASRCWSLTLANYLIKNQMSRLSMDPCIFTKRDKAGNLILIVGVYVDDVAIAYKSESHLNWFLTLLSSRFRIKNLGPLKTILGIEIHKEPQGFSLSQNEYIKRMCERFGLKRSKRARNPIVVGLDLTDYESSEPINKTQYLSLIGSLLYISNGTRPDITYALGQLARYNQDPRLIHWHTATRLATYLLNTCDTKLHLPGDGAIIVTFADSSWASEIDSSKSVTGHITRCFGGCITWGSKKQEIVALSSAEAEFIAISTALRSTIHIRELLKELKLNVPPTPVLTDSTSAISLVEHSTKRTRHVRLRYHNVRSCHEAGEIKVSKINTKLNPADCLTKALDKNTLERHKSYLLTDPRDRPDTKGKHSDSAKGWSSRESNPSQKFRNFNAHHGSSLSRSHEKAERLSMMSDRLQEAPNEKNLSSDSKSDVGHPKSFHTAPRRISNRQNKGKPPTRLGMLPLTSPPRPARTPRNYQTHDNDYTHKALQLPNGTWLLARLTASEQVFVNPHPGIT